MLRIVEPVKAVCIDIYNCRNVGKTILLFFSASGKHPEAVKSERGKSKVKPSKVTIPFRASEAFRDALRVKVKAEARDVSKLIRMLLRERYPDLPEE